MPSKRSILKQKKFWLGLIVSVVFLYVFASKPEWSDVWSKTRHLLSDPKIVVFFILPSIFLNLFSVVLRAWRWQSMLGEPWISSKKLFIYLSIGFLCNNTMPARAGEIIRTILVSKRESLPLTLVLATVVVERVFDFAMLLLFLGTVLAFVPFPEQAHTSMVELPQVGEVQVMPLLRSLGNISLAIVATTITGLSLLVYLPRQMKSITGFFLKPLPKRIADKIFGLFDSFVMGLSTFKRPTSAIWSFFLTVLIWLAIGYGEYLLILAFGIEGIPFTAALVIMVTIGIAVAMPSSPGYVGVFHTACLAVMTGIYSVDVNTAAAFAVVLWVIQIIPMICQGLVCLGFAGLSFREVAKTD